MAATTASTASQEPVGFLSQLSFAAHLDTEAMRALGRNESNLWKMGVLVLGAGLARALAVDAGAAGYALNVLGAIGLWLGFSACVWLLSKSHASFASVATIIGVASVPALAVAATVMAGPNETFRLWIQVGFYAMTATGAVIAAMVAAAKPE